MVMRDATPEDIEHLKTFGGHVPFGEIFRGRVIVDEDDKPRLYIGARKTTESYMAVDPSWESPGWRLAAIKALIEDMHRILPEEGFTDTYMFEDELEKAWVRRLVSMGCRKMFGKACFCVRQGDF